MSGNSKAVKDATAAERRDAIRRGKLWVSMDKLWAQIPDIGCKGHCHTHCGPIGMSEAERDRMDRVYGLRIEDGTVKRGTMDCPALTNEGRCGAYLARPTICRLWGASDEMPCEHGCEPRDGRRLNPLETMLLLNASLSLGQDTPYLPENYLSVALEDPDVSLLIRRFIAGDRSHLVELREKLIALWRGNGRREVEE